MLNKQEKPNKEIKNEGIVKIYGESSERNCGYCEKEGGISYGVTISKLTCEQYQKLIDRFVQFVIFQIIQFFMQKIRGWRRSGSYFYQPTNNSTCCPLYTIRLEVEKFKIDSSQKKVLKNFEEFIVNGKISEKEKGEKKVVEKVEEDNPKKENPKQKKRKKEEEEKEKEMEEKKLQIEKELKRLIEKLIEEKKLPPIPSPHLKKIAINPNKPEKVSLFGNFSSPLPNFLSSSLLKLYLPQEKEGDQKLLSSFFPSIFSSPTNSLPTQPQNKMLSQHISKLFEESESTFVFKSSSNSFLSIFLKKDFPPQISSPSLPPQNKPQQTKKEQNNQPNTKIEKKNDEKKTSNSKKNKNPKIQNPEKKEISKKEFNFQFEKNPLLYKNQFTVETVRSQFIQESYEVYKKYQIKIHGDVKKIFFFFFFKTFFMHNDCLV